MPQTKDSTGHNRGPAQPNKYIFLKIFEVLPSHCASERDLVGTGLCRYNQSRWGHGGWAFSSLTRVLTRRGQRHTARDQMTSASRSRNQSGAAASQGLPATTQSRKEAMTDSIHSLQEVWPRWHLDRQNFERSTFYCFRLPALASQVALVVKNLPARQETRVQSLDWEDPLEEEIAIHSRILAWRIQWTEEPGRLQSMGSQRSERLIDTFTFWWMRLRGICKLLSPFGFFVFGHGVSFLVGSSVLLS